MTQREWESAGLLTPEGDLDRRVTVDGWRVPGVVGLDGPRLVWEDAGGRRVRSPAKLVEPFIALSGADDRQILRFAQRYGPLLVCANDLLPGGLHSFHADDRLLGWNAERIAAWEPLAAWRHFSAQAAAILNVAARLAEGEVGHAEDVAVLLRPRAVRDSPLDWPAAVLAATPGSFNLPATVTAHRNFLALVLQSWLAYGGVGPSVSWDGRGFTLNFAASGLFGAIALQLSAIVAGSDGLAVCVGCGRAYAPSRRPRAGQRHYCQSCGRRTAGRDAARDYRQRQRA